jgi:hypothetical protein
LWLCGWLLLCFLLFGHCGDLSKYKLIFFQKLIGQMQYLAFILKNKQAVFLLWVDIMALGLKKNFGVPLLIQA